MAQASHFQPRRREQAVIRTWTDFRRLGADEVAAFHVCTILYRIHHPEASLAEARRLVAEWIDRTLAPARGQQ